MGNVVDRIGDVIVSQYSDLRQGRMMGRRGGRSSDDDSLTGQGYTYPTKDGSPFFSTHFIMGGERFETYQPEAFLFGENLDLNFLGSRPTPFPYAAPLANEPTRALRSLLNIRKESLRFIRVPDPTDQEPKSSGTQDQEQIISSDPKEDAALVEKKKQATSLGSVKETTTGTTAPTVVPTPVVPEKEKLYYTIEFMFDSDVACAARIFYFCTEETAPNGGVSFIPKDYDICSDKVVFGRGAGQTFSQSRHVFCPSNFHDADLMYSAFDESGFFDPQVPFPVVIQLQALEGPEPRQSHALIAIIERNNNSGTYCLKPFVQKLFIDGLSYLMQEIYGIENKMPASHSSGQKFMSPEEEEECNSASECVVCLSDPRDTLILPCRHLCLCYACADSLRYQANNCPICRSPFRALLQIRAVRTSSGKNQSPSNAVVPHSQSMGSMMVLPVDPSSPPVPLGFESLPLIEALNGPFPVSRDLRAPPDIDRTPVSVRRSHRRHKHSSSSHSHSHSSSSHHQHQHQQQPQVQPHNNQSQQYLLPDQRMGHTPHLLPHASHHAPASSSSPGLLNQGSDLRPGCLVTQQEVIPLPTRRILPSGASPVTVSCGSTSSILTSPVTGLNDQKDCGISSPPEPAPMDWKLLSSGTRIRRKQSDEETSSSASSGIVAQETTRLLNEGTTSGSMVTSEAGVPLLQRSASLTTTRNKGTTSGTCTPYDASAPPHASGCDVDSDDVETADSEDNETSSEFRHVLREVHVSNSNASQFDLRSFRLESGDSSDLMATTGRTSPDVPDPDD